MLYGKGHCDVRLLEKLYGFDKGKEYKFILLKFRNMSAFHKVKEFWYTRVKDKSIPFLKMY